MDVVVCYKIVPEEQDIVVNADRTLAFDRAELKIGQYDLIAIEAGMQIAESTGGKVIAVTAGGAQIESTKLKKSILSRGPHELRLISDEPFNEMDSYLTAKVLAAALQKVGHYDLVLCGEGSSDLYAQQVGVQLGELLHAATMNGVSKITPDGDNIVVERTLEDGAETLRMPLPCVLSVTADIAETRVPSMKDILRAGKKPSISWSASDIDLEAADRRVETVDTLAPQKQARKHEIIEGDEPEQVAGLYDKLRKEL
ncbi:MULTISPECIES: electron transfer flavoprotein [unclassified Sporolactobacillus]|uniref:electron transfer flavoprotein n=1 Tax=unclassified Sporolactobacillus TaxID=2628533 RepID=UPI002368145E|nr:electron transfer flavoprotein [Sporolactobacillus sp. CQH2019]MDD9146958.1 electron transfer flavoprotein [Sporolactobacillus sp. CQH2019]